MNDEEKSSEWGDCCFRGTEETVTLIFTFPYHPPHYGLAFFLSVMTLLFL